MVNENNVDWEHDYFKLEKQVKDQLANATPDDCIKQLHIELSNIHKGLILDNLGKIRFHYEVAQFIMENYYERYKYYEFMRMKNDSNL